MYLTINKRLNFSSSHRLRVESWSDEENRRFFGEEAEGEHGHGHNFLVWFGFHGPVDKRNGMIAELGAVKEKLSTLIDSRFDHKFLNVDTLPFHRLNPTPENIAAQLLDEAGTMFVDQSAKLVGCTLIDTPKSFSTAYANKRFEKTFVGEFSAARSTYSPNLTKEENRAIFGVASSPSGHGHNYRMEVTLQGKPDEKHGLIVNEVEAWRAIDELTQRWDHKYLNSEVPELANIPITTECLARVIFQELSGKLPVSKVRLFEKDDFFTEYYRSGRFTMGLKSSFNAAHRLHLPDLSHEENVRLYGKCNNREGHGHGYGVECVVTGNLDESSGALHSLDELQRELDGVLSRWNYKHLDLETDDFANLPSTGENIARLLWDKLSDAMAAELWNVRLWETETNLFEVSKEKPERK